MTTPPLRRTLALAAALWLVAPASPSGVDVPIVQVAEAQRAALREAKAWRERIQRAYSRARDASPKARARLLRALDPADQVGALLLEKFGLHRYREEDLVQLLRITRVRPVARAVILLLAARGTPSTFGALREHLGSEGVGEALAVRLLVQEDAERSRELVQERASRASLDDPTSMYCLRALALFEDERSERLLIRLGRDWSPAIRAAARRAMEIRADAGLAYLPPFRPTPYGEPIQKLAKPSGRRPDRSESGGLRRSQSSILQELRSRLP